MGDDILFQRYLDSEKTFQERKFPLKDALRMVTQIKALATKELIEMVWHNIGKVKSLYADVLLVDLGDIASLAKAISIRHDIVHRNGRAVRQVERKLARQQFIKNHPQRIHVRINPHRLRRESVPEPHRQASSGATPFASGRHGASKRSSCLAIPKSSSRTLPSA